MNLFTIDETYGMVKYNGECFSTSLQSFDLFVCDLV